MKLLMTPAITKATLWIMQTDLKGMDTAMIENVITAKRVG